jgi:hypothetical protein
MSIVSIVNSVVCECITCQIKPYVQVRFQDIGMLTTTRPLPKARWLVDLPKLKMDSRLVELHI